MLERLASLLLGPGATAHFEWEPRDLWVGAFWKKDDFGPAYHCSSLTKLEQRYDLWVCLVPCLPLHVTWFRFVRWDPTCGHCVGD